MIHQKSPAELGGIYLAVATKCKELKLTPGRRDTVTPQESTGEGNVNFRTIIQFAESVEAEPAKDDSAAVALSDQDKIKDGDSPEVIAAKEATKARKTQAQTAAASSKASREESHKTLRTLLGLLTARYAAAGVKPPEVAKTPEEIAEEKKAAEYKAAEEKASQAKAAEAGKPAPPPAKAPAPTQPPVKAPPPVGAPKPAFLPPKPPVAPLKPPGK